ncbi:MAG: phosphatase PAP2 family protein [Rhizomicrobium sp.]
MPQIAILVIVLSLSGYHREVYRFCLAVAVGAIIAIGIWTAVPSLGAKSIYALPASMEHRMALDVTTDYGRALVALLHNGPGYITPRDMRGLIAFPSYHAVLALLLIWYARRVVWLRWPALILNLVVLVSAPVQGGHHLIDIFGGAGVAIISVLLVRRAEAMKLPSNADMARSIPTFIIPGMLKPTLSPVSVHAEDGVEGFRAAAPASHGSFGCQPGSIVQKPG